MLITLSHRTAICLSASEVSLTGVTPLGAVSHRFNFFVVIAVNSLTLKRDIVPVKSLPANYFVCHGIYLIPLPFPVFYFFSSRFVQCHFWSTLFFNNSLGILLKCAILVIFSFWLLKRCQIDFLFLCFIPVHIWTCIRIDGNYLGLRTILVEEILIWNLNLLQ